MNDQLNILKYIGQNIVKSWKTTVFGAILFIVGIVTMFYNPMDMEWWQSAFVCFAGVFFACLKDPLLSKTKIILFLLGSTLVFDACVTAKKCSQKFGNTTIIEKDTLIVKETITPKDTTIYIAGDTVFQELPSPCDTANQLKKDYYHEKTNTRAKVIIRTQNNQLIAECLCLAQKQKIQILNRLLEKERISTQSHIEKIEIPIQHIPWYGSLKFILSAVLLSYLAGHFKLIQKLIKTTLKII